jgi:hypothetical protein
MTNSPIIVGNQTIGSGVHHFRYERKGTDVSWDYVRGADAPGGGDLHVTDTPGAWVDMRFNGTSIRLFGVKAADGGFAEISIDGGSPHIVDSYSRDLEDPALIYSSPELNPGPHHIAIRAAGQRGSESEGAYVRIRCAEITPSSPLPLSAVDIGSHTIGDDLHAFQYRGSWRSVDGSGTGGRYRMSETPGDEVVLPFSGHQVQLFGVAGPDGGIAEVAVDGGPVVEVDCYAPEPKPDQLLFTSGILPQAEHALSIRVAGRAGLGKGRQVALDKASVFSHEPPLTRVVVRTDSVRQRMESFSAASGWAIDPIGEHWSEENKTKIADLLYSTDKGIGLSSFRFYVGAGSAVSDLGIMTDPFRRVEVFKESEHSPYDWSRQAGQRWMMQAAKERGVRDFLAFTHSAPFWMNKNGHTRCDRNEETTNLKEGSEPAFAEFLADVIEHFRDEEGVFFNDVSPINEPGWSWDNVNEEGNRSNNEDMIRIIEALHECLARRGLPTRIIAPEAAHLTHLTEKGYLEALFGRPDIRSKLSHIVSAHSYFTDHFEAEALPLRRQLKATLDAYGGLSYWQTEYCLMGRGIGQGRDYGMTPALWMAKMIHADLTLLDASAWHWWLSVSPGNFNFKDGLLYTDWFEPGDPENVIESKMLWAFGNYSRFIRPGSYRVELSGIEESTQFMGSAYVNTEYGRIVAVFVNDSQNKRPVKLSVPGQTVSRFEAYVTSDRPGDDLKLSSLYDSATDSYAIPPRSVVTLVAPYTNYPANL